MENTKNAKKQHGKKNTTLITNFDAQVTMNLSSLWMLKYAEIFNFAESIEAKRVLRGSFTYHIII